jgi:hypothetical protein
MNLTEEQRLSIELTNTLAGVSEALGGGEWLVRTVEEYYQEIALAALREALASIRNREHRDGQ